jgi:nudix-type nucleoside diphosphatase (YffH/AdpP family)
MPEIRSEKIIREGVITIEKAEIRDEENTFERYRVLRQDAAVVLLYNPETDRVILTKQFRYPVAQHQQEDILECVAGKIDNGELPSQAAIRETEEETGYHVVQEKLQFLTTCFVSPGYSTERFHLFFAEVTDADKRSEGGGQEQENERIALVELPWETFLARIRSGEITDGKTCLIGLWCDSQRGSE